MSSRPVGFGGSLPLVPQELRGYRRFRLAGGRLFPTVYASCGPWSGEREEAVCGDGSDHDAPASECGCGIYGWYHPSRTASSPGFGDVTAVIAVRGRAILGDQGFRSASARIEAVALPMRVRLLAARRTRQILGHRYPSTTFYRSRRRMFRDYPPVDLSGLGITVTASPTVRYMRMALAAWVIGTLLLCSMMVLPKEWMAQTEPVGWMFVLGGFVLWQALLIWLASRCSEAPRTPPAET